MDNRGGEWTKLGQPHRGKEDAGRRSKALLSAGFSGRGQEVKSRSEGSRV